MRKLLLGIQDGRLYSPLTLYRILQSRVCYRFQLYFCNTNLFGGTFALEQFTRALDLMNRSLAVGGQVDLTPQAQIVTPVLAPSPSFPENVVPHGFRDLVEYRCAQQGILCVPIVNRFHAGRPIFRVGNVLCYFDRQVLTMIFPGHSSFLLIFIQIRWSSRFQIMFGYL